MADRDALEGAPTWEDIWVLCSALPVACYTILVESLCVYGLLLVIYKIRCLGKVVSKTFPTVTFNNHKLLKKYKQKKKVLVR